MLAFDTSEEITVDTASDTAGDMTKEVFVTTADVSEDQEEVLEELITRGDRKFARNKLSG